jgi:hypothetical protein
MKHTIVFLLFLFFSCQTFSQTLEGEWEGLYKYEISNFGSRIKLRFVLNKDSSYSVLSYTHGYNSLDYGIAFVCKVRCKYFGSDSILLEESRLIKPTNYDFWDFKKLSLKTKADKNVITLEGVWETISRKHKEGGAVMFTKVK